MKGIGKRVIVRYRDDSGKLQEFEGVLDRYQLDGVWYVQIDDGDTLLDMAESCVESVSVKSEEKEV